MRINVTHIVGVAAFVLVAICFLNILNARSHVAPFVPVPRPKYVASTQVAVPREVPADASEQIVTPTDVALPRALNGDQLRLFDPFSVPDQPDINCVPLKTAVKLEKICTYSSDKDAYISKVLNAGNVWEHNIVRLVQGILKRPGNEEMGFIELGTNLGVFAVTVASMNHTVVGAEPLPSNLVHLAKTMRLNKHLLPRLRILPNATSDKYETMYFWAQDNDVHPGGTKTRSGQDTGGLQHHKLAGMTVKSIRTDDMLHFIDFKRAILKADIEGGEFKAFQTAKKIFDTVDITHVFMEWNKKYEIDEERKFFINFFKNRGYTVHRVEPALMPLELSEDASRKWPFDVVFVKESQTLRAKVS